MHRRSCIKMHSDMWDPGSESAGVMEAFQVGDYLLVARPQSPEVSSTIDWVKQNSCAGGVGISEEIITH